MNSILVAGFNKQQRKKIEKLLPGYDIYWLFDKKEYEAIKEDKEIYGSKAITADFSDSSSIVVVNVDFILCKTTLPKDVKKVLSQMPARKAIFVKGISSNLLRELV